MLPIADRNPATRPPVFTVLLIGINLAVFVFWQGGGTFTAKEDSAFTYEHAAIPCELTTGHPVTDVEVKTGRCFDHPPPFAHEVFSTKRVYLAIVVSMFLHGGWLHLLGNMLFLWIFGNNIEDRWVRARFVGFYLLGGIVATFAQVALDTSSVITARGRIGRDRGPSWARTWCGSRGRRSSRWCSSSSSRYRRESGW